MMTVGELRNALQYIPGDTPLELLVKLAHDTCQVDLRTVEHIKSTTSSDPENLKVERAPEKCRIVFDS